MFIISGSDYHCDYLPQVQKNLAMPLAVMVTETVSDTKKDQELNNKVQTLWVSSPWIM